MTEVQNAAPATKLTPALIADMIEKKDFYVFPGTTLTVCAITLKNGFMVTGESRPILDANFNKDQGETAAYNMAFEKLWAFAGYEMRLRLAEKHEPG